MDKLNIHSFFKYKYSFHIIYIRLNLFLYNLIVYTNTRLSITLLICLKLAEEQILIKDEKCWDNFSGIGENKSDLLMPIHPLG